MAMDEALKLKIKEALKVAGLDEALAENMKIEKEDGIEAAVKILKDAQTAAQSITTLDQLMAKLNETGLGEVFKKILQSETDRRVTEGVKTHDAKLEQQKKAEAEEAERLKSQEGLSVPDKQMAAMSESIKQLTDLVTPLIQTSVENTNKTAAAAALKAAELPETFIDHISFADLENNPVDKQVTSLKEKIDVHRQAEINKELEAGGKPGQGGTNTTVAENAIKEYAEGKNKAGVSEGGFVSVLAPDTKITSPEGVK